jgi:hypothetical protein
MKFVKMTIFAALLTAVMSLSAMAQKDDKRQDRPKPPPPVVKPGGQDKPPNGNPPKGNDRPKKPEMSWFFFAKNVSREEVV